MSGAGLSGLLTACAVGPPRREAQDDPGAVLGAGVCDLCPGGCGAIVRERRDRRRFEGVADHPVGGGDLCERGLAGPPHPAGNGRPVTPLRRDGPRGSGRWRPATWAEAIADLSPRLSPATAMITPRLRGHRAAAVDIFLAAIGAPPAHLVEPFSDEAVRAAHRRAGGPGELPAIDLPRCRRLLSIGSPLLDAGPSPVWFRRGLSGSCRVSLVAPRRAGVGSASDDWIPARPGTETALLLAIAGILLNEGRHDRSFVETRTTGLDAESWTRMTPERAAEVTDVPAPTIRRIARSLARERPSCVLVGGSATGHRGSVATCTAAVAVNALLGAYGRPGGLHFPAAAFARMAPGAWSRLSAARSGSIAGPALLDRAAAGGIDLLIAAECDPVSAMPRLSEILPDPERINTVVALSLGGGATTHLADWILPAASWAERPCSDVAEGGPPGPLLSLSRIPASPPDRTPTLVDTLIGLNASAFPWRSELDMLFEIRRRFLDEIEADAWRHNEIEGLSTWTAAAWPDPWPRLLLPADGVEFAPPEFERYPAENPLVLVPYDVTARSPEARRRPEVELHPRDAAALGIVSGSSVILSTESGNAQAVARHGTDLMAGAIAVRSGWTEPAPESALGEPPRDVLELLVPVPAEWGGIARGDTRAAIRPADRGAGVAMASGDVV